KASHVRSSTSPAGSLTSAYSPGGSAASVSSRAAAKASSSASRSASTLDLSPGTSRDPYPSSAPRARRRTRSPLGLLERAEGVRVRVEPPPPELDRPPLGRGWFE